MTIEKPRHRYL